MFFCCCSSTWFFFFFSFYVVVFLSLSNTQDTRVCGGVIDISHMNLITYSVYYFPFQRIALRFVCWRVVFMTMEWSGMERWLWRFSKTCLTMRGPTSIISGTSHWKPSTRISAVKKGFCSWFSDWADSFTFVCTCLPHIMKTKCWRGWILHILDGSAVNQYPVTQPIRVGWSFCYPCVLFSAGIFRTFWMDLHETVGKLSSGSKSCCVLMGVTSKPPCNIVVVRGETVEHSANPTT